MTIEELFGTLQQSVISTWRKHLRTAKYAKHIALNEFYEEMPDKVDALIEAWMGVNGRKIKSYDNILQSKNMNTLTYLKELRKIVKQGYSLMNGEAELEAKLDDIVELIDSTLYKVKELYESKIKSKIMNLQDFLTESLITEAKLDSMHESVIINLYDKLIDLENNNDVFVVKNVSGSGKSSRVDVEVINKLSHKKHEVEFWFEFQYEKGKLFLIEPFIKLKEDTSTPFSNYIVRGQFNDLCPDWHPSFDSKRKLSSNVFKFEINDINDEVLEEIFNAVKKSIDNVKNNQVTKIFDEVLDKYEEFEDKAADTVTKLCSTWIKDKDQAKSEEQERISMYTRKNIRTYIRERYSKYFKNIL